MRYISVKNIRPLKRFAASVFVVLPATFLLGDSPAQAQWGCTPVVVGYHHAYDVVTVPVCNFFGCQYMPQQIPCQHPILQCR